MGSTSQGQGSGTSQPDIIRTRYHSRCKRGPAQGRQTDGVIHTGHILGQSNINAGQASWISVALCILGHHLEPGDNSEVTYSRDELSRLMVKVEVMFQDIRKNKFKPDDSRVRRIAEQSAEVIDEVQVSESEPDSDDCSVADLDRTGMGLEPERAAFDDLTIDNACNSLVHIHSGVLHVLNDGGASFVCGRKRTKNYRELERTSVPTDIPVCIQCAKSLLELGFRRS